MSDQEDSGRSWGYGVNSGGSSRLRRIRSMAFQWQRICSISGLRQRGRNEVWLSDITYIPTEEGWLYLAGHKDLFTGEVVGYAMGSRITKHLVSQSLFRAVAAKRPGAGLIHHSDRGSQYCAHEYRKLVDQFKMRSSMRQER